MRVLKSLSAQRRSTALLRKGQQLLKATFSYSANSERTHSIRRTIVSATHFPPLPGVPGEPYALTVPYPLCAWSEKSLAENPLERYRSILAAIVVFFNSFFCFCQYNFPCWDNEDLNAWIVYKAIPNSDLADQMSDKEFVRAWLSLSLLHLHTYGTYSWEILILWYQWACLKSTDRILEILFSSEIWLLDII